MSAAAKLATRILVPTDFSVGADRALGYATALARLAQADVFLHHVIEFLPTMDPEFPINRNFLQYWRQEGERGLAERAAWQANGHPIKTSLSVGQPSDRLIAAAQEAKVDLIVMGTHGRTGLDHVLLGSTAERVIAGGPCPVLAVRTAEPHGAAQAGTGQAAKPISVDWPLFRRLLVPMDFSDHSLAALEKAVAVASLCSASLTLLHALEPVSYGLDFTLLDVERSKEARAAAESRLSRLATPLIAAGHHVETAVRGGLPTDAILHEAGARRADLIVMGTHGRRGLAHVLVGSVAEHVLRRASCPVLAVKSPTYAS